MLLRNRCVFVTATTVSISIILGIIASVLTRNRRRYGRSCNLRTVDIFQNACAIIILTRITWTLTRIIHQITNSVTETFSARLLLQRVTGSEIRNSVISENPRDTNSYATKDDFLYPSQCHNSIIEPYSLGIRNRPNFIRLVSANGNLPRRVIRENWINYIRANVYNKYCIYI